LGALDILFLPTSLFFVMSAKVLLAEVLLAKGLCPRTSRRSSRTCRSLQKQTSAKTNLGKNKPRRLRLLKHQASQTMM